MPCNHSTLEWEAGGSRLQGQPQLWSKFKASLGRTIPCLQTTTKISLEELILYTSVRTEGIGKVLLWWNWHSCHRFGRGDRYSTNQSIWNLKITRGGELSIRGKRLTRRWWRRRVLFLRTGPEKMSVICRHLLWDINEAVEPTWTYFGDEHSRRRQAGATDQRQEQKAIVVRVAGTRVANEVREKWGKGVHGGLDNTGGTLDFILM